MSEQPIPGEPQERSALIQTLERPRRVPLVDTAGEYAGFVVRSLVAFRLLPKFTAEVLRQVGFLVAGSALVVIFICFIVGAACGIAAESVGQAIGASVTGPIFSSFCVNREIVPFLFGFILAAKVGGGIVAQLGAMRVNQEVDAMEIIGIPSLTFMVSTRMLASAIVLPILYLISLGAAEAASWMGSYVRSQTVSQGTWEFVYYTVTNVYDIVFSFIKGLVISGAVVTVALYFGYRVRGGPVEVGTATAQSMAVNLILVTVLNMTMTFLFWGFNPRLPIA